CSGDGDRFERARPHRLAEEEVALEVEHLARPDDRVEVAERREQRRSPEVGEHRALRVGAADDREALPGGVLAGDANRVRATRLLDALAVPRTELVVADLAAEPRGGTQKSERSERVGAGAAGLDLDVMVAGHGVVRALPFDAI